MPFDEETYCSICGDAWTNHSADGSCPNEFEDTTDTDAEREQEEVQDV